MADQTVNLEVASATDPSPGVDAASVADTSEATTGKADAAPAVNAKPAGSGSSLGSMSKRSEKRRRQRVRKNLERLTLQGTPSTSAGTASDKGVERQAPAVRQRSEGSTPESSKPPSKKQKVVGPTFSEKVKKELVVFVGSCFGEEPLSSQEFCFIKRSLNRRILERVSTAEWPVQVEGCVHYSGKVRISCADEASLGWIREEAKKLVPESKTRKGFSVMGPGDLPPTRRCTAWVPVDLAEDKVSFLKLLRRSNRGLNVDGIHLTKDSGLWNTSRKGSSLHLCG